MQVKGLGDRFCFSGREYGPMDKVVYAQISRVDSKGARLDSGRRTRRVCFFQPHSAFLREGCLTGFPTDWAQCYRSGFLTGSANSREIYVYYIYSPGGWRFLRQEILSWRSDAEAEVGRKDRGAGLPLARLFRFG